MGMIKNDIDDVVNALIVSEGRSPGKVARRLIEAGLRLLIDEGRITSDDRIAPDTAMSGEWRFVLREPQTDAERLSRLFRGTPIEADECYHLRIGDDGNIEMLVATTCADPEEVRDVVTEAAELLGGYSDHHMRKVPPQVEKAQRNLIMAAKLYGLLGVPVPTDPHVPDYPVREPQEHAPEARSGDGAPTLSVAPDRKEICDWITSKAEVAAKCGEGNVANTLAALSDELRQHLEERPVNTHAALHEFYLDVHQRNVKAGWWSDLATGKPKKRSVGEMFMLIVTELVEAYDAYLSGSSDDKLPQYPGIGVELGDLQIRLADFMGALVQGSIVEDTSTRNPGAIMFADVCEIARGYEAIRKTDAAVGDEETGEFLPPMDPAKMVIDKLAFNAKRPDHKLENRLKEDGKRT